MKKYGFLSSIKDLSITEDTDLTSYSTIKLKSQGSIAIVKSKESLVELVSELRKHKMPYQIIGLGANTFLREIVEPLIIKIDIPWSLSDLEKDASSYYLPANVLLSQMIRSAIKNKHAGWEAMTGIPATLGGAITMNAGTALGEIAQIVESVELLRSDLTIETLKITPSHFSYRNNNFLKAGDIILGATVSAAKKDSNVDKKIKEYYDYRKRTQPLSSWTCGCLFKNSYRDMGSVKQVCRAGQFLDVAGLKGFQIGNVRMSPIHANFLENTGGATYSEIINFINIIQSELQFQYGFKFELEVWL